MGQYYRPTNITKGESIYPHDYGNGLKLMEHSYIGNNFVNTVEQLLLTDWSGDEIVWAGDYADEETGGENLYTMYRENTVKPEEEEERKMYRYIVSLTSKEYVDMEVVIASEENVAWVHKGEKIRIHPLPLLLADGNGRGGGDYHSSFNSENVGRWAKERIVLADEVPADYVEISGIFSED